MAIERESKVRSTLVRGLAQDDIQVVCSKNHLGEIFDEENLVMKISSVANNNSVIVKAIVEGITKLGLVINEDKTGFFWIL